MGYRFGEVESWFVAAQWWFVAGWFQFVALKKSDPGTGPESSSCLWPWNKVKHHVWKKCKVNWHAQRMYTICFFFLFFFKNRQKINVQFYKPLSFFNWTNLMQTCTSECLKYASKNFVKNPLFQQISSCEWWGKRFLHWA